MYMYLYIYIYVYICTYDSRHFGIKVHVVAALIAHAQNLMQILDADICMHTLGADIFMQYIRC